MNKKVYRSASLIFYLSAAAVFFVFSPLLRDGILSSLDRCVGSLLPSVFPMLVLSKCIMSSLSFGKNRTVSFLSKLFGISENTFEIFITGLICGFPAPAVIAGEKYKIGEISKEEAEFSLPLCNSSSPAFVISYIGGNIFSSPMTGILIFVSHFFALITAAHISKKQGGCVYSVKTSYSCDFVTAVKSSVYIMLEIVGFVVFFSLISDMIMLISRIFPFLELPLSVLSGLCEITCGIGNLTRFQPFGRLFLAVLFNSFGGISSYFQVRSAVLSAGLSMKGYLKEKLVIVFFSVLYTAFSVKISEILFT